MFCHKQIWYILWIFIFEKLVKCLDLWLAIGDFWPEMKPPLSATSCRRFDYLLYNNVVSLWPWHDASSLSYLVRHVFVVQQCCVTVAWHDASSLNLAGETEGDTSCAQWQSGMVSYNSFRKVVFEKNGFYIIEFPYSVKPLVLKTSSFI